METLELSNLRRVSNLSHESTEDYGGIYVGSPARKGMSSSKYKKHSNNLEEDIYSEFDLQSQNDTNKRDREGDRSGDQNIIAMIHEPATSTAVKNSPRYAPEPNSVGTSNDCIYVLPSQ